MLKNDSRDKGHLAADSRIKAYRVFSVSNELVHMKIGTINKTTHDKIKKILIDLIG